MGQMPANIRVSSRFPFPALVTGAAPITLTKLNGVWTVGLSIAGLAVQNPPPANFATDYILMYDSVAQSNFRIPLSFLQTSGLVGTPSPPQGRLTLTSGTAVPTTDVAAAATIYYTPAVGRFVPIWSGALYLMTDTGGELSQATTDATKSPAAVANNSNYDIFVWSDNGAIRATRGPAWTSDTARGAGAGTTELLLQNGIYVNKNAITNGPAAGFGTYVGTVRSNGTATIDMKFGTSAAGGGTATLGVWNLYNRVTTRALVQDSNSAWTYTLVTPRAADASNGNRVNFVCGLALEGFSAINHSQITFASAAGHFVSIGIGLDVTNAYFDGLKSTATNSAAVANIFFNLPAPKTFPPQLGFHFAQALENSDGTNAATFLNTGLEFLMSA